MPKSKKPAKSGSESSKALALPGLEGFLTPPGQSEGMKDKATRAMEKADERQIAALASGDMAVESVYQYEKGKDIITGISYVGFRMMFEEIFKTPLPIFLQEPVIELVKDDPRGPVLVAHCVVQHPKNKKLKFPAWAEQSVYLSQESKRPNFHARAVVSGKLLRNAIRGLIHPRQAARFLEKALKVKERVELLSKEKEEGKSRRQSILGWIMNIAKGAGLDTNKEAEVKKLRNAIVKQFQTRLSDMEAHQLQAVGEWLAESVEKHGKKAFMLWIEQHGTA